MLDPKTIAKLKAKQNADQMAAAKAKTVEVSPADEITDFQEEVVEAPVQETEIENITPEAPAEVVAEAETVKPKRKPRIVQPKPVTPVAPKPQTGTAPVQTGKFTNIYESYRKTMAEVPANTFAPLADGTYTGTINSFTLETSKNSHRQQFRIEINIETYGGLPKKGKIWNYLLIEHSNETVVRIAWQKLTSLLAAVGVQIADDSNLEELFNNLTEYFEDAACVVVMKNGFPSITDINGIRC